MSKVKVRRANKNTTPLGTHWTITKIINEPDRKMGFALSDDGTVTAFIPNPVIKRYEMTSGDEGAGFSAPTTRPATNAGSDAYPQISTPLLWDGDAIEVEINEETSEEEIDEALGQIKDMHDLMPIVALALKNAQQAHIAIADSISQLNGVHNALTESIEWERLNYGENDSH